MEQKMERIKRIPNILVAEDDSATGMLMMEFLMSMSFTPDLAVNGREAYKLFQKNCYDILITDIEMPEMNGVDLIKKIREKDSDTIIIITSVHSDSSHIIETMKLGVYDYIIKPVNLNDLSIKLDHAFRDVEQKRSIAAVEKERKIRSQKMMDWYRFEERIKNSQFEKTNKSLFQGITRSFSQGAGIGVLISLLDILYLAAKKNDEKSLIVDKELLDIIYANGKHVSRIIDRFQSIVVLEDRKLEYEEYSIEQVYDLVKKILEDNNKYALKKKIHFVLSENKKEFSEIKLKINEQFFMEAVNETIINAVKFSETNTIISVLVKVDSELSIIILNTPSVEKEGVIGIPEEYENIVFEPFFRVSNNLHEEFDTMEYGIGLTFCEKVLKNFGGNIGLYNILDWTDNKKEGKLKVCCEMTIPLIGG